MSYIQIRIEWLSENIMLVVPDGVTTCIEAIEAMSQISSLNPQGKPINFIFDFSSQESKLTLDEGIEMADLFLALMPFRTSLAIIFKNEKSNSPGRQSFRKQLEDNGFLVSQFFQRQDAVKWLDMTVKTPVNS